MRPTTLLAYWQPENFLADLGGSKLMKQILEMFDGDFKPKDTSYTAILYQLADGSNKLIPIYQVCAEHFNSDHIADFSGNYIKAKEREHQDFLKSLEPYFVGEVKENSYVRVPLVWANDQLFYIYRDEWCFLMDMPLKGNEKHVVEILTRYNKLMSTNVQVISWRGDGAAA